MVTADFVQERMAYLSKTNAVWQNDTSGLTTKLSPHITARTMPEVLVKKLCGPEFFHSSMTILLQL